MTKTLRFRKLKEELKSSAKWSQLEAMKLNELQNVQTHKEKNNRPKDFIRSMLGIPGTT